MSKKLSEKSNIFIGGAWPYANGSLHLGHVSGLIGADFLARYFRLKGNKVLFISGSDCHGAPIEVKADKLRISPKKIVEKYDKEFRDNLIDKLGFSYDLFSKTTSKFHHKKVQEEFLDLLKKGYIYKKVQKLTYCEKCKKFLPDRYVEGKCPKCGFEEARGDQCDECGNLLDPRELLKPKCKICETEPTQKDSEHFFLKLKSFEKELLKWVNDSEGWRGNAKKFTINFIKEGLIDRAITRDSEWGIPIPLPRYEGKCIYVWFEAVSGYLTASQKLSEEGKLDWKDFWKSDNAFHYYVHGKDNIPFHSIIWPAILLGLGGLNLPDRIVSSEYLSFEGKQFSKGRNWGIWLPEFLKDYEPDTLRYYLGISGPETSDSDFTIKEFKLKVNTELLGKFGNYVNRVLNFTNRNFSSTVPAKGKLEDKDKKLLEEGEKLFQETGRLIEETKFKEALGKIKKFAENCNKYIDEEEPWKIIKEDKEKTGRTIYTCIQSISILQTLLLPFLPFSAEKIRKQLNVPERKEWKFHEIKEGHKIGEAKPIYKRI